MANFHGLPALLLLLFLLHWQHGAASLPRSGAQEAGCILNRKCAQDVLTQIRQQVRSLSLTADDLFVTYSMAQGKPFNSTHPSPGLCSGGLLNFPSFHGNTFMTFKMAQLYRSMVYFAFSLMEVGRSQEILHPDNKNLQSQIKTTADTVRGLINNLVCGLCNLYNLPGLSTLLENSYIGGLQLLDQDTFMQKKLGCQLLAKYKDLMSQVAQAFL